MPPKQSPKSEPSIISSTDNTMVYVERKETINLGNFNNASVTVGVTLPINPTRKQLSEISATIEIAYDLVDETLRGKYEEIVSRAEADDEPRSKKRR